MNPTETPSLSVWRDGRVLVPFVAVLCLFTLASAMKNILHTPENRVIANLAVAVIVFCVLVVSYHIIRHEEPASEASNPGTWSVGIIISAAFIAVYSL
jgi:quinol-cytochrome oxidoreductase complex cytochrome b subunit